MKRILLGTAFVLATAGVSSAQEDSQLRQLVSQELSAYGTDITVDQLSDEQVSELYLYATSTDSTSVKYDKYRRVLDDLGDEGTAGRSRLRALVPMAGDDDSEGVGVEMPRNQLRSLVAQMLETWEQDVDINSLSDDQLVALYLIDTGSESESEQQESIDAVLNGL